MRKFVAAHTFPIKVKNLIDANLILVQKFFMKILTKIPIGGKIGIENIKHDYTKLDANTKSKI